MNRSWCFGLLLVAATSTADMVTLKNGTQTQGAVVSVDAAFVIVESEVGTQKLNRSAVRSIEFGQVLVTGIKDSTFTSKEGRIRFVAPEGWALYKEPGLDFAAKKSQWFVMSRSLPLEGAPDGGESLIKGAIAGMASNMAEATAGEPRSVTWGAQKATRVDISSPQMMLAVVFLHLPQHFVLFAAGAPPDEFAGSAAVLSEWEKGFSLIPE